MDIKIGTDIVYIPRFKKKALSQAFFKKVFHPSELKNKKPESLAGIFAAKEAIIKALNLSLGNWHELEIKKEKSGRPRVIFNSGFAKKLKSYDLTISHDKNFAVAVFATILK